MPINLSKKIRDSYFEITQLSYDDVSKFSYNPTHVQLQLKIPNKKESNITDLFSIIEPFLIKEVRKDDSNKEFMIQFSTYFDIICLAQVYKNEHEAYNFLLDFDYNIFDKNIELYEKDKWVKVVNPLYKEISNKKQELISNIQKVFEFKNKDIMADDLNWINLKNQQESSFNPKLSSTSIK